MRDPLIRSAVLFALATQLALVGAAQVPDLSGVEIVTHPVAGPVYMLEATKDVAGNIAVSVGSDGILIIDDQFAPLTDQISAALADLSSGELRFILNTHYHEDHADGNEILSRDGAVIVAHTNTRKRLLHLPKGHWPVITFDHQASVHFNGEEIQATWYPGGHTDSDLVFYFTESNVFHLGDLWNTGTSSFPVVDIEAGGSAMRILENIEKLISTVPEDARIIPGHGPVSDLAELRSYRDMLEETIGLVRGKWEAGRTLEQIQAEGLQPKYESWGWGYLDADGWIEGIVRSLETARVDPTGLPAIHPEAIREHAVTLGPNAAGYWEADFGNGHIFVHVPAGPFMMGSDEGRRDERPVHQVDLDEFWIAKYPATVGQFRAFIEATGYVTDAELGWGSWQWTGELPGPDSDHSDPWEPQKDGRWNNIYFSQGDDHPVGSVSWNDANAYAEWLSSQLGLPVVLPTEAQWEKAARGTDARRFPWGDAEPHGWLANYADLRFANKYGEHTRRSDRTVDDGFVETSPVDAFPPGASPYGAMDLAGNLGEWVHDIYDPEYYAGSPRKNPSGPPAPSGVADVDIDRVNRGGSWVDWAGVTSEGRVEPQGGHNIRAAARTGDEQNSSDDHMGFRIAIDGLRRAPSSLNRTDRSAPEDPS